MRLFGIRKIQYQCVSEAYTQLWFNNKSSKFLLLEIKLRLRIFQETALD